jgi:hypothetical protein
MSSAWFQFYISKGEVTNPSASTSEPICDVKVEGDSIEPYLQIRIRTNQKNIDINSDREIRTRK